MDLILSPISDGECLEFLTNSQQKYSFANIAVPDFADGQFKSGLSIEVIKIMDGWDVVHPFGQFRFQRILCATLLILLEKKNKGGLLKFADICVCADDVWRGSNF